MEREAMGDEPQQMRALEDMRGHVRRAAELARRQRPFRARPPSQKDAEQNTFEPGAARAIFSTSGRSQSTAKRRTPSA